MPSRLRTPAWRRLRHHRASIIVWLVAVAVTVVLFRYRAQRVMVLGAVQADRVEVMPGRTARVERLAVELLDQVEKGQVLAILRDEQPRESLLAAKAEIDRLQSELTALATQLSLEAEGQAQDRFAAVRRAAIDVDATRLRKLELKTVLEPDRVQQKQMAVQIDAAQELADRGLFPKLELQTTKAEYEALTQRIAENERLLEQVVLDLAAAEQRQTQWQETGPGPIKNSGFDTRLAVIQKAIRVQELKVQDLEREQASLVLTAPFSGSVTAIYGSEGGVAMPGEPLLTLMSEKAETVLAYLEGEAVGSLAVGDRVELVKRRSPVQKATTEVVHVGQAVSLMPERFRLDPQIETWGQAILIALPQGLEVLPGEMLAVHRR